MHTKLTFLITALLSIICPISAQELVKPATLELPAKDLASLSKDVTVDVPLLGGSASVELANNRKSSHLNKLELGYTLRSGNWHTTASNRRTAQDACLGLFSNHQTPDVNIYQLKSGVKITEASELEFQAQTGDLTSFGFGLRRTW